MTPKVCLSEICGLRPKTGGATQKKRLVGTPRIYILCVYHISILHTLHTYTLYIIHAFMSTHTIIHNNSSYPSTYNYHLYTQPSWYDENPLFTAGKIPAWLALSFPNEGSKSPVCPKGVVPDDPEIRGIRGKNPRFLKNDHPASLKSWENWLFKKLGMGLNC